MCHTGDKQFKHIQRLIEDKGISVNICAADEHLPEIERHMRTVKERSRSIATTLQIESYPHG